MKVSIFIFVLFISSLAFASDRDDYLNHFKSDDLKKQEVLQKKRAKEEAEAEKKLLQMVQEIQQRQGQGDGQTAVTAPAQPTKMPSFMDNPAAMVRVSLRPLRENMTEQQVSELITKKAQGTFVEKVFKKFPKVPQFAVKALRDENALPELARIVEDKKRLGIFAVCNIATIFIGFLLKRRKSSSVITGFIFRVTVLYSLRIGIFIYFFHKEASPLWNIFLKTFLPS